jgi:hypothetical protein
MPERAQALTAPLADRISFPYDLATMPIDETFPF